MSKYIAISAGKPLIWVERRIWQDHMIRKYNTISAEYGVS